MNDDTLNQDGAPSVDECRESTAGDEQPGGPDFSFLGSVRYSVPPQRVERVWSRLAQSHSTDFGEHKPSADFSRVRARGRYAGPMVALAACVAAFGVGVWFGEQRGQDPSASAQRVSAEPRVNDSVGWHRAAAGSSDDVSPANGVGAGQRSLGLPSVEQRGAEAHPHERPSRSPLRGLSGEPGRSSSAEPSSAVSPANPPSAEPSPTANLLSTTTLSAVVGAAPNWQRLANNGEYEAALVEITHAGGFERTISTATAEQLMLLSDVARATGQQQRALASLRRILSEYSSDPVAPLAALNLGNLLDKMGDGAGATQAFAVYRSLSPQGDFAEDALVRQIRSAVSAGQQELAKKLVAQYGSDFPEGRRADEVARWSERLPEVDEGADAGATHQVRSANEDDAKEDDTVANHDQGSARVPGAVEHQHQNR